eukprot:PITA_21283
MLTAFGFSLTWVRWLMTLISSPLYSVLVNRIPSKPYSPSRGIYQGDPLFPFLFIIMVEGLGCLIKQAVQSLDLRGISVHVTPAITHQQFVDDNMLFGHPSISEARTYKALLAAERIIAPIIGFSQAKLPSHYLGAPLIDSTLKHASWHQLTEKMESRLWPWTHRTLNMASRLLSWTHRTLNMASRLVLIKVVLQSMPLYLFSVLATPKWVLKRIKNIQRNLLWGSTGQNSKWALVKWDKVCKPKKQGGLGLRD